MTVKLLTDVKLANAVRVDGREMTFFDAKNYVMELRDWEILKITKLARKPSAHTVVWTTVANTISWHMDEEVEDGPSPTKSTTTKAAGSKK